MKSLNVDKEISRPEFLQNAKERIEKEGTDRKGEPSPYERTMENYKVTKQMLIEIDRKNLQQNKEKLEKMKKERELRNSQIKMFMESQNNTISQINRMSKGGYSPHMHDFDHTITNRTKNSPLMNGILNLNIHDKEKSEYNKRSSKALKT